MVGQAVRWSPATVTATGLSAIQAVLAIMALAHAEWRTTAMLVVVAALTLAAALSVVQAMLPIEVKAVLLTGNGFALLALGLAGDAFGLHATRIALDNAEVASLPSPDVAPPRAAAQLTITPTGGAAALGGEIAAEVAQAGAPGGDAPEVEAEVSAVGDGASHYRMVWSLRRGDERRWCGQALIEAASRKAAAAGFAAMIVRARAVPPTEPLRCE